MRKFLVIFSFIFLTTLVYSAPPVEITKFIEGKFDGTNEITVSSTSTSVIISTGASVSILIKNYGAYDIFISTDPKIPIGARYRLEVGESPAMAVQLLEKALFGKSIAGNPPSTIYTIQLNKK